MLVSDTCLFINFSQSFATDQVAVIVGPLAQKQNEGRSEFSELWAKNMPTLLELRRFQDGSIRESIQLHNPDGPAYLNFAIVNHLIKAHLRENVSAKLIRIDEETLLRHFQTR